MSKSHNKTTQNQKINIDHDFLITTPSKKWTMHKVANSYAASRTHTYRNLNQPIETLKPKRLKFGVSDPAMQSLQPLNHIMMVGETENSIFSNKLKENFLKLKQATDDAIAVVFKDFKTIVTFNGDKNFFTNDFASMNYLEAAYSIYNFHLQKLIDLSQQLSNLKTKCDSYLNEYNQLQSATSETAQNKDLLKDISERIERLIANVTRSHNDIDSINISDKVKNIFTNTNVDLANLTNSNPMLYTWLHNIITNDTGVNPDPQLSFK